MASASYCEDLTCAICLTIFTDPVTLLCGHSFCRGCITDALSSQQQCPQCRRAVPAEVSCLPTNHILKSMAEKAKEAEKIKKEHDEKQKAEVPELCPEHEEKLKLFCVTDQQLACIICRDGESHKGHTFKPIKEAAASLRKEFEKCSGDLRGDITATESLANTQREEIANTKERSQQLMTQIHGQFEEMHKFLKKREDEIKNELKYKEEDAVEKMSKSLNAIETHLSESRKLEGKLTSVLRVEDSERFLTSWTEGNSRMSPEDVFKPRADDLKVVNTSLSLGPYESHLQFFMWKEMLQVIQTRAELLSFKSNSSDITVSDDGRSLFCSPKSDHTHTAQPKPPSFGSAFGSTTGSAQKTGSIFGSSSFSSSTGSAQTRSFATVFNKPPKSMFGSTANFGLGSTAGPAQTAGSNFGNITGFGLFSTPGSVQTAGSNFGQSSSFSFGSAAGSAQTTGLSFGQPSFSVGSTAGSAQTTGLSFGQPSFGLGSTAGSAQTTGSNFGKSSGFTLGSTAGSAQTTGFSFVSTGLDQTMTSPDKDPEECEDNSLSSSSGTNHAFSVDEFTSEQHYWEIDVGQRDYWELGITDNFLKYDAKKYSTCRTNKTTELEYEDRPRKIGIYLNCTSQKLSFYNADNMTHIHTENNMSSGLMSKPLSAYVGIRSGVSCDRNPLTVCWY